MSNRTIRVNELLQRELSDVLRRRYQSESVSITISEIRVSTDLHEARVFVSIIGDETHTTKMMSWLRKKQTELRTELAGRIVLKFFPKFTFILDDSVLRGNKLLAIMDKLGLPELPPGEQPKPSSSTPPPAA